MASSLRSKMRCVLSGLTYETASKRVYKSKRCVLFMTFRPSQRTLFMARSNWVLLALRRTEQVSCLIFTGHLRKWLCYVYAELQINQLKPNVVIKLKSESCFGCGTQYIFNYLFSICLCSTYVNLPVKHPNLV